MKTSVKWQHGMVISGLDDLHDLSFTFLISEGLIPRRLRRIDQVVARKS
jgi:hypothetical protein